MKTITAYDAAAKAHAQSTEVCLNPCLFSQSIQFAKVTLKTQYIQTKP